MKDMLPLIEPLIPALRRYARALMRNSAAADDLVQDCLERAITRWHQRREDGDAKAWIFRMLHNLAINRLQQARRRGQHVAIEDAGDQVLARPPAQEERLRHRDLLQALETLPEDQKAVLLLISVEDVSYAEAARILDVPVGTIMSRLSRGRERLRQAMELGTGPAAARAPNLRRVK